MYTSSICFTVPLRFHQTSYEYLVEPQVYTWNYTYALVTSVTESCCKVDSCSANFWNPTVQYGVQKIPSLSPLLRWLNSVRANLLQPRCVRANLLQPRCSRNQSPLSRVLHECARPLKLYEFGLCCFKTGSLICEFMLRYVAGQVSVNTVPLGLILFLHYTCGRRISCCPTYHMVKVGLGVCGDF
jgi:hypothetical protein